MRTVKLLANNVRKMWSRIICMVTISELERATSAMCQEISWFCMFCWNLLLIEIVAWL